METLVFTLNGSPRFVVENGREFLVCSATLIVPGVLPGSRGPLLYLAKDVANNARKWNGVPIVLDHPTDPRTGEHVSANEKGVWERQGLGEVRNVRFDSKLRADCYFDIAKTKAVNPEIYKAIRSGAKLEVSTGLFTRGPEKEGVHNGRSYQGIAQHQDPDHLAVLSNAQGACSLREGCGLNVNANPEGHNQYTGGSIGARAEEAKGLREKIKAHYASAKEDAQTASDKAGEHADAIREHVNQVASVPGSRLGKAFDRLDNATLDHDKDDSPADRHASLKEIQHHAEKVKEHNAAAKTGDDDEHITEAEKASNHEHLSKIVEHASAARQALREHVGHRREMQAIRKGTDITGNVVDLTEADMAILADNANPEGHNQYSGGGGREAAGRASEHADYMSAQAETASSDARRPGAGKAARDQAAKANEDAAQLHREHGSSYKATQHTEQAVRHRDAAKQYRGTHNAFTTTKGRWEEFPANAEERMELVANGATENAIGSGNHGLAKRASYANQCTDNADAASKAAKDSETHEAAKDLHDEAMEAHTGAMKVAASKDDYSAASYHQQKAEYHAEKSDEHGTMVTNDDVPEPTDGTMPVTGNTWTDDAREASIAARAASKNTKGGGDVKAHAADAVGYAKQGDSKSAALSHGMAAHLHEQAAKSGGEGAMEHTMAASAHNYAAKMHNGPTVGKPAMNRKKVIAELVDNCKCSPPEEVLNEFDDDKLEEFYRTVLVANAATQGFTLNGEAYRVNPDTGKWEKKKTEPTANRFGGDEKGASKQAAMASVHAGGDGREAALQAMDSAKEGNAKKAANLHTTAAKTHEDDALAARKDGDEDAANQHDIAAMANRKAASCHQATMNQNGKKKAKNPTGNTMTDSRKFLRQLAVNGRITQDEYKSLSAHSDSTLALLLNKKKSKEDDEEDEEDDDEPDDNIASQDAARTAGSDEGYNKNPVKGEKGYTGNKKSAKQWLAEAPPQLREVWNDMVENQNQEHSQLVERLTENFAGEEQAELRREYSQIPLKRLRVIARAQLGQQQVSNGFVMPTYLGAAGGGYTTPTENAGVEGFDPEAIRAAANKQYEDSRKKTA